MKKIVLLSVFLSLLALIAYFFIPKEIPVQTKAIQSSVPVSAPPKNISTPKTETITTSKSAAAPTKNHEPSEIVHFRVEQGLAVAMGDIIIGRPEEESTTEGNYPLPELKLWDKPEIPYVIDHDIPDQKRILDAIQHVQEKTGIQFTAYTTQMDGLLFKKGTEHCLSALGRQGGLQLIQISDKCQWQSIVHELLHSFGLMHEQSRFDRDSFVSILWDSIEAKYKPQFEKLPESFLGPLREMPFDYKSVMLYNDTAFAAIKGSKTMASKTPNPIAPSETGMSAQDIIKVKTLFRLN